MPKRPHPHRCPFCEQPYNPRASVFSKAGACACPPAPSMVGTYRVAAPDGAVERLYGHEKGNHGEDED